MSLDLVRVDDRLIHGQVVVGWGRSVHPRLIVLADDEVVQNMWERELYEMGVPDGIDVEFHSIDGAIQAVARWRSDVRKTIVLIGDVASLTRLCDGAPSIRDVNLGGIHHEGHRRQLLPYLFLTDEEADQLRALARRGVRVTAQDLPNTAPVDLGDLL